MEKYDTAGAFLMIMNNSGLEARLIRDPETTLSSLGNNFSLNGRKFDIIDEVRLDDQWTVARRSIDFITAIKAEKKVRVEYDPELLEDPWFIEFHPMNQVLNALSSDFGVTRVKEIITKGKWYIE